MSEKIHQAAILRDGDIWTLPKPARHHNILWAMHDVDNNSTPDKRPKIIAARGEQGFVTSAGRFVGREEAYAIAIQSGQIKFPASAPPKLYSEDVW